MNSATSGVHSVQEYLDSTPDSRRADVEKVREVILENLPPGYEESFEWGMITYQVPLNRYPDTYNGKPLMYAALSAQKNHLSLYLTGIYISEEDRAAFEKAYRESGKRLDAAKSCVRFKSAEDVPLEVIGKAISSLDIDTFVQRVERIQRKPRKKRSRTKSNPSPRASS